MTWVEIGVFGASCATVAPMLPGGIPPEGAAARVAFDRTKMPPPIGDLTRARYAFAAVGKDSGCAVKAVGCTDVDVDAEDSVEIALAAIDGGAAACPGGSRCVQARCVSSGDNGDPALGADCSLALVGAGPLADPLLQSSRMVSAPAIAATVKGFLVAYREYGEGQASVAFISIDNGGGATAGPVVALPDRCAEGEESDALAMAFSMKDAGRAMVTRAACPSKSPGFDQLTIDDAGALSQLAFQASPARAIFSAAHAVAVDAATTRSLVAFTRDGSAFGAFFGLDGKAQSSFQFGGAGTRTGAWVAATDQVRAFVAVGVGGASVPVDGGAADASPALDAAAGASTVRVQIQGTASDPTTLATQQPADEFSGSWASLSANARRVVVTSDAPGADQISYRVYDGAGPPTASDVLQVDGTGKVAYADTALHQEHLFFAVERAAPPTASTIALHAYEKATTTPTFKRLVVLPNDPRIPSLTGVRDGLLAVAASDTRVGVVWTTGKTLSDKDAVGGYAIFACSTP